MCSFCCTERAGRAQELLQQVSPPAPAPDGAGKEDTQQGTARHTAPGDRLLCHAHRQPAHRPLIRVFFQPSQELSFHSGVRTFPLTPLCCPSADRGGLTSLPPHWALHPPHFYYTKGAALAPQRYWEIQLKTFQYQQETSHPSFFIHCLLPLQQGRR